MTRTAKKVCLFTGATGTLGSAFCARYADEYRIVAVSKTRAPHDRGAAVLVDPLAPDAELPENRDALFAVRADLAAPGEISRVVELALARFDRIDLIVNAAALAVWSPLLASNRVVDTLADVLRLNVIVPLELATEVARRFWRDRDGENRRVGRNVVNLSSTAGIYVYPGQGQSGYSASKAALNLLSCHLADELAPIGVRVNALAPNSFPGRVETAAVADAIVRLDRGDQTGSVVVVDEDGESLA
jgi:NAD(P)-dependent dehydrogenase (short-subunit alcohol dehydrogenase family)